MKYLVIISLLFSSVAQGQQGLKEVGAKGNRRSMLAGQAINLVGMATPRMCNTFYKIPSILIFYAAAASNILGEIANKKSFTDNLQNDFSQINPEGGQLEFLKGQIRIERSKKEAAKKRLTFQQITTYASMTATAAAAVEATLEAMGKADTRCLDPAPEWMSTVQSILPLLFIGSSVLKLITYHDDYFIHMMDEQNYLMGGKQSISIDEYEEIKNNSQDLYAIINQLTYLSTQYISGLFIPSAHAEESKTAEATGGAVQGLQLAIQKIGETVNQLLRDPWTRVVLFGATTGLSISAQSAMKQEYNIMEHNISVLEQQLRDLKGQVPAQSEFVESAVCLKNNGEIDKNCLCQKKNQCQSFKAPQMNFPAAIQEDMDGVFQRSNQIMSAQQFQPIVNLDEKIEQFQKSIPELENNINQSLRKNDPKADPIVLADEMEKLTSAMEAKIPNQAMEKSTDLNSYKIRHGHMKNQKPIKKGEAFDFESLFMKEKSEGPQGGIVFQSATELEQYEFSTGELEADESLFERISNGYLRLRR